MDPLVDPFDPPLHVEEWASSVLQEADRLVSDTNMTRFGPPSRSFNRIAEWWTTYIGGRSSLNAHDVAMMMALFKLARVEAGIEADGEPPRGALVDFAGFVACSDHMLEEE